MPSVTTSSTPNPSHPKSQAIAAEQTYVDMLFDRLDKEVADANQRLNEVQADVDPANPDSDALVRRETEYHLLQDKLDRLNLAQLGLVFGRVDVNAPGDNPTAEGLDRRYIGRMGLDAREENYRTLLLDWRAPMARPFYLATTAQPEDVAVRRHIRTKGRTVTDITDEVLSRELAASYVEEDDVSITSESALHQAMDRARTSHMNSIVETIQREQDEIIRDERRGVMVVDGGPGTGKTAVALHRIAYLLYNHRERLSSTGVLILGPNSTLLDYISRVLPELGETGVVLSTISQLFPGVTATAQDSLLTREIKGSAAMVDILRAALQAYQVVPDEDVTIKVEQLYLTVTPAMVKAARTRARRSRKPHMMPAVLSLSISCSRWRSRWRIKSALILSVEKTCSRVRMLISSSMTSPIPQRCKSLSMPSGPPCLPNKSWRTFWARKKPSSMLLMTMTMKPVRRCTGRGNLMARKSGQYLMWRS